MNRCGIWALLFSITLVGCQSESLCDSDDDDSDGIMCGSRLNREVKLSDRFTTEQQEQIILGGNDWERMTEGRVKLTWVIVSDDSADISPLAISYARKNKVAGILDRASKIWLRQDLVGSNIRVVAAHELGHTFGLGHRDDAKQVMNSKHGAQSVNAVDVEHFNELYESRVMEF